MCEVNERLIWHNWPMTSLRTMDMNLLRALDALLDERNVTRAAARLALTQPAMSGILQRLRETFGDPLFVRAQRGIVPTARALDLQAPLRQVLADIDALLQPAAFEPGQATLTVSVSATDYALRAIALPFLALLRASAPRIRVALVPVDGKLAVGQLERGEIDLALVTTESTPPDLHARTLFEERYVCVMRSEHPAARGKLTLDRFCALEHALVSYAGARFEGVTDAALAKLDRQRRVALSVSSFLILPEILRASDLVAVVPSRLAQGLDGIVVREPPLAIPGFTKAMAWHERTHRDPARRWVREMLVQACAAP